MQRWFIVGGGGGAGPLNLPSAWGAPTYSSLASRASVPGQRRAVHPGQHLNM